MSGGYLDYLLPASILELRRLRAKQGKRGLLRLRKICAKAGHDWKEVEEPNHRFSYCRKCLLWPLPGDGEHALPPAPIPAGRLIDRSQRLPRPGWFGEPLPVGELFRVAKHRCHAACRVVTHRTGWEVRLIVRGEIVQTQVCRSPETVFFTGDGWRQALQSFGWR